jgi:hypothetical protein
MSGFSSACRAQLIPNRRKERGEGCRKSQQAAEIDRARPAGRTVHQMREEAEAGAAIEVTREAAGRNRL